MNQANPDQDVKGLILDISYIGDCPLSATEGEAASNTQLVSHCPAQRTASSADNHARHRTQTSSNDARQLSSRLLFGGTVFTQPPGYDTQPQPAATHDGIAHNTNIALHAG
jgi:hypothetical protein